MERERVSTKPIAAGMPLAADGWLRSLMVRSHRPNVLVESVGLTVEAVASDIAPFCLRPLHLRLLPCPLRLPMRMGCTVLIGDIVALTPFEQAMFCRWLEDRDREPDIQVVSIASRPLWPYVKNGGFLERLFYRLNVVHVTRGEDCRRNGERKWIGWTGGYAK